MKRRIQFHVNSCKHAAGKNLPYFLPSIPPLRCIWGRGGKEKGKIKREKEKKEKKLLHTISGSSNYFQQYYAELDVEIRFTCNRQTIQLRRAGTSLKFNERRSFAGLLACACRVKLCRNKSGWVNRACPPSLRDTLPATPVSRG